MVPEIALFSHTEEQSGRIISVSKPPTSASRQAIGLFFERAQPSSATGRPPYLDAVVHCTLGEPSLARLSAAPPLLLAFLSNTDLII